MVNFNKEVPPFCFSTQNTFRGEFGDNKLELFSLVVAMVAPHKKTLFISVPGEYLILIPKATAMKM